VDEKRETDPDNKPEEISDMDEEDTEKIKIKKEDEDKRSTLRRTSRISKPPIRYQDEYAYANYCSVNVPNTYEEAMLSNEAEQWSAAMKKERNSLNENKTWSLVSKPDKEVLDVKWVYEKN